MNNPDFINPLSNPLFIQTVLGLLLLFLISFILLSIYFKANLKLVFKSNIGLRLLGWAIITPLYLLGIFFGRIPGLIIITLVIILALKEATEITGLSKIFFWLLSALALISVLVADYFPEYFYSLPLIYFSVLSFSAVRLNDPKRSFYHAIVSLFLAIWIIFGLSHLILLSYLNDQLDSSRALLVLVIFAVCLSDMGSYFFGKLFAKLNILNGFKIASNISPNKTYIGILGQIIGALVGIVLFYPAVSRYLPGSEWLVVGVLIGLFSASGGMINSMFKRYFDVKNSGTLIPGHGGLLDRVDSLIRVVIVIYYFFSISIHH